MNDFHTPIQDCPLWFVMRDLKRCNAKQPAYKLFKDLGMEVFTPMVWKLSVKHPIVEKYNTVQYRYLRGGYKIPMTVRESDMQRFIHAVQSSENPCYYTPEEISSDMIGRKVRIVGGPLDGYEGYLQKIQGAHVKRLFVELPSLLAAAVAVQPEYIQLL